MPETTVAVINWEVKPAASQEFKVDLKNSTFHARFVTKTVTLRIGVKARIEAFDVNICRNLYLLNIKNKYVAGSTFFYRHQLSKIDTRSSWFFDCPIFQRFFCGNGTFKTVGPISDLFNVHTVSFFVINKKILLNVPWKKIVHILHDFLLC